MDAVEYDFKPEYNAIIDKGTLDALNCGDFEIVEKLIMKMEYPFNSIDLKRYKIFSMICYILMGWCIIFKINLLPTLLTMNGFILLLSGGIVYTLGAILYIIGKRRKWMHSLFHISCIIGSLLQFLCILFYVI